MEFVFPNRVMRFFLNNAVCRWISLFVFWAAAVYIGWSWMVSVPTGVHCSCLRRFRLNPRKLPVGIPQFLLGGFHGFRRWHDLLGVTFLLMSSSVRTNLNSCPDFWISIFNQSRFSKLRLLENLKSEQTQQVSGNIMKYYYCLLALGSAWRLWWVRFGHNGSGGTAIVSFPVTPLSYQILTCDTQ